MARSNNEYTDETTTDSARAWENAAVSRKYGVWNGTPYIGAEGHVVFLQAPEWFGYVTPASRGTVFQALVDYVSNNAVKPAAKADNATHEAVQAAATSAISNGFDPGAIRTKDPVEAEVERRFASLVRERVLAKMPQATDSQIAAFTEEQAETERGQARMEEFRSAILESGTYTVQRKNRKGATSTLELGEEFDLN